MRYLVTGAAGLIGGAIARRLMEAGHEVWTIDNLSTGRRESIPTGTEVIKGACQDPDALEKLPRDGFSAILHFAGQSSGEVSFDDPVYDLRTNTEATLRLIQYGLTHDCPRFVYASSMSVYGDVPDQPIAEGHETKPLSFYGVGKLASEHYLRLHEDRGIQPTSLRLFNVYGPGQNMANLRQGMISIYLAQLLREDRIIVKGSPERFRDFISIHDVVDVTVGLIDDQRAYGQTFNVGTGVKTTVADLLNKLIHLSGISREVTFTDSTPGDQRGIWADLTLIKASLDFRVGVGLDDGLLEMIEWAKRAKW